MGTVSLQESGRVGRPKTGLGSTKMSKMDYKPNWEARVTKLEKLHAAFTEVRVLFSPFASSMAERALAAKVSNMHHVIRELQRTCHQEAEQVKSCGKNKVVLILKRLQELGISREEILDALEED